MIRGIRGAITVKDNTEREIVASAGRVISELISKNKINPEKVASVFISVTEDLTAAFPAKALRSFPGWSHVPVMCMKEIPVPSSLAMCIRVMLHVDTEMAQEEVKHVYMGGAKGLRPDLLEKSPS
ncbi:chorismate mutase [Mesobacillus zeae]|uniref:chorismate mutase n=1 Tax=Mesobacillus zeae TaxID=1917180 RepID=A0A398B476_9BACI|nr:chorismate mutase [Mesobacillus zeae]RID82576.1 chorismate mutase [Mesobacillus zeae]